MCGRRIRRPSLGQVCHVSTVPIVVDPLSDNVIAGSLLSRIVEVLDIKLIILRARAALRLLEHRAIG